MIPVESGVEFSRILIRTLAGDDASAEIKAYTERYESFAARYYEDF